MKAPLIALALVSILTGSVSGQTISETVTFDPLSGINGGKALTIYSFNVGVKQPAVAIQAGGRGSAAKSTFTPITLYKSIDQTTPQFFIACALGKVMRSATLSIISDDGQNPPVTFFQISLRDVIISSVNDDAQNSDGGTPFLETIGLSYDQIGWKYTPTDGSPAVSDAFDLRKNGTLLGVFPTPVPSPDPTP